MISIYFFFLQESASYVISIYFFFHQNTLTIVMNVLMTSRSVSPTSLITFQMWMMKEYQKAIKYRVGRPWKEHFDFMGSFDHSKWGTSSCRWSHGSFEGRMSITYLRPWRRRPNWHAWAKICIRFLGRFYGVLVREGENEVSGVGKRREMDQWWQVARGKMSCGYYTVSG